MAKRPAAKKSTAIPPDPGISVVLVKSRKNPHVLILRALGKFASHECFHCGEELMKNLSKAFTSKRRKYILNLAGVSRLDAVGIGALAGFIEKCHTSNVKLVLCAANPHDKEVLEITKLIPLVPHYKTEKEAMNSLS